MDRYTTKAIEAGRARMKEIATSLADEPALTMQEYLARVHCYAGIKEMIGIIHIAHGKEHLNEHEG